MSSKPDQDAAAMASAPLVAQDDQDRLLTVEDVCERLRLSRTRV